MTKIKPAHDSLEAVGYYGADLVQDVIVGAQLSQVTTANGAKILDWTSGQVSGKQTFRLCFNDAVLRYNHV